MKTLHSLELGNDRNGTLHLLQHSALGKALVGGMVAFAAVLLACGGTLQRGAVATEQEVAACQNQLVPVEQV